MGEVSFYHLTHSPLDVALPELLHKTRARGWRAFVRSAQIDMLLRLDERLWLGDEAGFLAHGVSGGAHDAEQPILLSTGTGPVPNGADILFVVENGPLNEGEIADFTRVCVMFDGNNTVALELARTQWKTLSGSGHAAHYWAQDASGWVEKASVNT